jgi:hypothetical protein
VTPATGLTDTEGSPGDPPVVAQPAKASTARNPVPIRIIALIPR